MQIEILKSKIHRATIDDLIIIASYAMMDFAEAKLFTPAIIFPDKNNKLW